jgi:hypothetical protein
MSLAPSASASVFSFLSSILRDSPQHLLPRIFTASGGAAAWVRAVLTRPSARVDARGLHAYMDFAMEALGGRAPELVVGVRHVLLANSAWRRSWFGMLKCAMIAAAKAQTDSDAGPLNQSGATTVLVSIVLVRALTQMSLPAHLVLRDGAPGALAGLTPHVINLERASASARGPSPTPTSQRPPRPAHRALRNDDWTLPSWLLARTPSWWNRVADGIAGDWQDPLSTGPGRASGAAFLQREGNEQTPTMPGFARERGRTWLEDVLLLAATPLLSPTLLMPFSQSGDVTLGEARALAMGVARLARASERAGHRCDVLRRSFYASLVRTGGAAEACRLGWATLPHAPPAPFGALVPPPLGGRAASIDAESLAPPRLRALARAINLQLPGGPFAAAVQVGGAAAFASFATISLAAGHAGGLAAVALARAGSSASPDVARRLWSSLAACAVGDAIEARILARPLDSENTFSWPKSLFTGAARKEAGALLVSPSSLLPPESLLDELMSDIARVNESSSFPSSLVLKALQQAKKSWTGIDLENFLVRELADAPSRKSGSTADAGREKYAPIIERRTKIATAALLAAFVEPAAGGVDGDPSGEAARLAAFRSAPVDALTVAVAAAATFSVGHSARDADHDPPTSLHPTHAAAIRGALAFLRKAPSLRDVNINAPLVLTSGTKSAALLIANFTQTWLIVHALAVLPPSARALLEAISEGASAAPKSPDVDVAARTPPPGVTFMTSEPKTLSVAEAAGSPVGSLRLEFSQAPPVGDAGEAAAALFRLAVVPSDEAMLRGQRVRCRECADTSTAPSCRSLITPPSAPPHLSPTG